MSAIVRLHRLGFPWVTLDPFLFCVHHLDAYPRGNELLGPEATLAGRHLGNDFEGLDGWRMYHGEVVPGFPQHPHRGFETVTIVRQGLIDHSDSLGATARFGPGDVQWLTAGRGIVHCEMFPLVRRDAPNPTELFQIWLNLPKANKMVEPHFSMLWSAQIPERTFTDAQGATTTVRVIAGALGEVQPLAPPPKSWAASAEASVAIWTASLTARAQWQLPAVGATHVNRMVYVVSGSLTIDGQDVSAGTGAQLDASRSVELKAGQAGADVLVLQGRPIGERVVSYGPFVMNSEAEIQQAFIDYQRTQFGGWPWRRDDPVHAREQARFARHVDGRVETP